MKFLKRNNHTLFLKLILGVIITFIGYLTTMFYFELKNLDKSVSLIANANEIQIEFEQLLSTINNNENCLQNFIISKDKAYLKNHLLYKKEIRNHLQELRRLKIEQPEFKQTLDKINVLINNRTYLFDQTLKVVRKNNFDKKLENLKLLESNNFNYYLDNFIGKIIKNEAEKVFYGQIIQKKTIENLKETIFILAILSLLIFLVAFYKMNVDLKKFKTAYYELKILNGTFSNAEQIAGLGHWEVNLKTNKYTYSDNYIRMLDLEPENFDASLENVSQYVHYEDRERMLQMHKESLINKIPTATITRFLLDNGNIKYFKNDYKFSKNNKGEDIKIAVSYDITNQYLNTIKLEESNRQLLEINTELESFNSIVSHDLQEPLRKIQMFISRLESDETNKLSPESNDYFQKIKISASRMQNLMVDLVNYTRALKGGKIFITSDLNDLFDGIEEELETSIKEKNAVLIIGNLPILNVIPFQIQQMFINLISNSLKYTQAGIDPKIEIFEQNLNILDIEMLKSSKFRKIIIKDNGIGFKQEYAENIFGLFKRLKTEINYVGTGLGLAICKKIIENHSGVIKAIGKPGIGAKFIIYLPEIQI
jgi:signal transduction histidine kinase/CHASE3 domain sensor protein